jgi:hypothetical protein
VGAELDPREEGLDVVEEIVIVLSLDTGSFSYPALLYVWSRIMPGPKSPDMISFFFFSFRSSHYRQPSGTKLSWSRVFTPIFLFLYARIRRLDTGIKRNLRGCLPGQKSSSGVLGMQGNDG